MKAVVRVLNIFLLLVFVFALMPTTILAQNLGNIEVVCESDVVVQADDWLSKIADKFFGDVLAFPTIVEATNAKAAFDSTYVVIENPNIIEPGWKLCIPNAKDAQLILDRVNTASSKDAVKEEIVPAPRLVEYNSAKQFVWEWEGGDKIKDRDWYFDIKIYKSYNSPLPDNTLVADPEKTQYLNGKWYSDLPTNFQGCSHWAVQIAIRDTSGNWVGHISPESERLKAGPCQGDSTFSSPIN
jgi:hypothetical protein